MAYDETTHTIYVGNSSGKIYSGKYAGPDKSIDFFSRSSFSVEQYGGEDDYDSYITNPIVNSLQVLDSVNDYSVDSFSGKNQILAATDAGVFRSCARQYVDVRTIKDDELSGLACD